MYDYLSNSHYRHENSPNLISQAGRFIHAIQDYIEVFLIHINIYALYGYFCHDVYGYATIRFFVFGQSKNT